MGANILASKSKVSRDEVGEGILGALHNDPVIPVWLCAMLSGRHRNQMYRLIGEGRLATTSVFGTKFVTIKSFAKYMAKRKPKRSKSVLP